MTCPVEMVGSDGPEIHRVVDGTAILDTLAGTWAAFADLSRM